MSSQIRNEELADRQSSSSPLSSSRKRRRHSSASSVFDDDSGTYSNSLNPLFLVSGPRGGVLNSHHAEAQLAALVDAVDDGVLQVLREAWAEVAVPADMYWSSPQHLCIGDANTAALLQGGGGARRMLNKVRPLRIPHPRQLPASFYPTRVEALAARDYQPHRGLLPVALDRRGGKGSKVFNVLPRREADATGNALTPQSEEESNTHQSTLRSGGAVASFIDGIPYPLHRNLYVMVDEDAPVDPYFDVDLSYSAAADDATRLSLLRPAHTSDEDKTAVAAEAVEVALLTILTALREEVEQAWKVPVAECLVLSSSLQLCHHSHRTPAKTPIVEDLKLSFHVHFRLGERAVVTSVRELHAFMMTYRARLQREQVEGREGHAESSEDAERARRASLLLACVDFGVYTRWRPFRLPYNVKAPEGAVVRDAADRAGDDLRREQLLQLGCVLPDVSVGSAAPSVLHSATYAADAEVQRRQRFLLDRLLLYFRFLLPLLPGGTHFVTTALEDFLRPLIPEAICAAVVAQQQQQQQQQQSPSPVSEAARSVVGQWVVEMACIVRDATFVLAAPRSDAPAVAPDAAAETEEEEQNAAAAFHLLPWPLVPVSPAPEAPSALAPSPFDLPMPPMPRSVRTRVEDREVKKLLAEIFCCLAPEYGPASPRPSAAAAAGTNSDEQRRARAAVTAERINAQYEESIRAYYVFQKQSKFCYRLQRAHKATYVQLYLTFGSIKLRCYSNDCCDRCCVVPWEAPANASPSAESCTAPYPKFERLTQIRNLLFPPLPAGELVRRYGTALLQQPT